MSARHLRRWLLVIMVAGLSTAGCQPVQVAVDGVPATGASLSAVEAFVVDFVRQALAAYVT